MYALRNCRLRYRHATAQEESQDPSAAPGPTPEPCQTIDITISPSSGPVTISVVKRIHPTDSLYVEFKPEAIETVLSFLWESEWCTKGETPKSRNPTLPPGVRLLGGNRKKPYYVVVDQRRHFCLDIESAVAKKAAD